MGIFFTIVFGVYFGLALFFRPKQLAREIKSLVVLLLWLGVVAGVVWAVIWAFAAGSEWVDKNIEYPWLSAIAIFVIGAIINDILYRYREWKNARLDHPRNPKHPDHIAWQNREDPLSNK